jgi:hypothetical protein
MSYVLVVLKPFQGFKRGDVIKEVADVENVVAGNNANFVVRVNAGKE